MSKELDFTDDELNLLDVAIRQRMKSKRVENIQSYIEMCKNALAKVRTEQDRREQVRNSL